jgi:uncharacterized membrane protein
MIWAILFFALVFRLAAINQSLWLDEAIGAIAAKNYSYSGIVFDFLKSDNHSPLYYLTLKGWASLFGFSDVSLRLLSVLFGVAGVAIIYLIAKKLVNKKNKYFPLLSALLLASSPFHIYYSQEARMYIMAAFFASLAIYSFLLLVDKKTAIWGWALFSFSITALIFTDYMPVFILPIFWIYSLIKKKDRNWWGKLLVSHIPLAILGLLWIPVFKSQVASGRWLVATLPAWKQVAGGATFKQAALTWMKFVLGRISLKDKLLYYSLVSFASIPVLLAIFKALKDRKKLILIWFWLLFPLILGFVASFWFPAFVYFRFVFVVPAFYLLISWGVGQVKRDKARLILGALLLLVNVVGWLIYISEPYQQREQWRQAVEFIERRGKEQDVVVFEYPEPFAPYRWYAKGKVEAMGVTNSISADSEITIMKTKETVLDKEGVYYFEYLRDLSDPQRVVEATLEESGFVVESVFDLFPGIGQITYWIRK